jgi:excisionase family DNA binding protein
MDVETAVRGLVDALRAELTPTKIDEPDRLLSVADACLVLGISRSRLYEELSAGNLHSLTIGRRRLISNRAVRDYIERAA